MAQPQTLTNPAVDHYTTIGNKSEYHTANHNDKMRDKLELYRYDPKPNASTYGRRKSKVKTTRDVSITNPTQDSVIDPIVFETNASIPVGANIGDIWGALKDHITFLVNDDINISLAKTSTDFQNSPMGDLSVKGEI